MTTSQQAASALVDALMTEHRAARPVESLILLRLLSQATEIRAAVDALAAARRAEAEGRRSVADKALLALVGTIDATGGLVEHARAGW